MPRSHCEMGDDRAAVGGAGATESTAASPTCSISAAASLGGSKRGRDPGDEVYLDNFHSHKRYLSEIMASSLNGLSVGDPLAPDNLAESPARSESACYLRDEIASQYSPMSEESDDCRCCENPSSTTVPQSDVASTPTSPVSPHRHQNPFTSVATGGQYTLNPHHTAGPAYSHPLQRGSDSEGRFPSSPNDMCHTIDLRRAALLRSVQMRTQPHCPAAHELSFSSGQENSQGVEEGEGRSFSCVKGLYHEAGYQRTENEAECIEHYTSLEHITDPKHVQKHD